MILLTPELDAALRANDEARRAAVMADLAEPDFVPIAKFFNPVGAATWLATELGEDGDTLFGLVDLGFGCPELGSFSLSELASVRLPFGLGIERDLGFATHLSISGWAAWARRAGSIIAAEQLFRRGFRIATDEVPEPVPRRVRMTRRIGATDEGRPLEALPRRCPDAGGAFRRQTKPVRPNREIPTDRHLPRRKVNAMKLDFIDLGKLSISKANMRYAKKAPDVTDILPTVRARGVLVPLIVRHNVARRAADGAGGEACPGCSYEIVAGARRFTAATIVAGERGEAEPLPCAILEDGDDAAALEVSLIENVARRDPDEVTQWETYTRLITKEGRTIADIALTFGMPEAWVKRILALGNLLPRIRSLYAKAEINAATVRQLTLATKSQQREWLALFDNDQHQCPTGHQLKAWLFGGGAIKVERALFDIEASGLAIVADLFGEDRYFADSDAFWTRQNAVIETRREAYLDEGWRDVVIIGPREYFSQWEYRKAGKRKGGRVYIDISDSGEVTFHEGYVTSKEAARLEKAEQAGKDGADALKPVRSELSSRLQTYVDLHRHAAVRAALVDQTGVALRLMVAHVIAGSPLWTVRIEAQSAKDEDVRESVEVSRAEALFDEKRRAVLALLGFDAEEPTVTGGNPMPLALLFQRLLDLPDRAVMDVIAVAIGETLFAGSAAVEAVGLHLGVEMAAWWSADDAFFEGLRDKEVLTAIVAEVGGADIAAANAKEKGATLKAIIRDHLDGANGRAKVKGWVPRWMTFPPAAYTARGGVGTVSAYRKLVGADALANAGSAGDAPEASDVGADVEVEAAIAEEASSKGEGETGTDGEGDVEADAEADADAAGEPAREAA